MRLSITKNIDQVTPSINSILSSIEVSGRRQVLMDAGKEFLRMTRDNFGNNTYKDKEWSPLSKIYAKKVGHSNATLKITGELFNSIKLKAPTNDSIEIYTKDKRAAALCFGYKPRHLPARNFFPMINYGSPAINALTLSADRGMFNLITKKLNVLSKGSLPYQQATNRSTPTYGNPFTAT